MSPSSRRSRPTRGVRATPAGPRVRPTPSSEDPEDAGDAGDDEAREGEAEELAPPTAINAPFGRLGAGAGVAYALVGLAGSSLLPIGKVQPEDPASAIAAHLTADRGRISAGILLTLFGLFFLLVFVSWLHGWLRQAEGEGGWLATLALGGGLVLVGMLLVVVMLSIASTVLNGYGDDPVIARALLVLQWQAVAIAFVPAAAYVGATGLIGFRSGWLPRWLCYAGMAIAVAMLVPPLAFVPFILSTLWTGMLAIVLLQQGRALR